MSMRTNLQLHTKVSSSHLQAVMTRPSSPERLPCHQTDLELYAGGLSR